MNRIAAGLLMGARRSRPGLAARLSRPLARRVPPWRGTTLHSHASTVIAVQMTFVEVAAIEDDVSAPSSCHNRWQPIYRHQVTKAQ